MERLKQMKETLMSSVQSQLGNLDNVDAKELGEAVDMIKDLSEAIYYCTITEEMEEYKEEKKIMDKMENKLQSHSMPQQVHQHYYPIPEYNRPYYRDMIEIMVKCIMMAMKVLIAEMILEVMVAILENQNILCQFKTFHNILVK